MKGVLQDMHRGFTSWGKKQSRDLIWVMESGSLVFMPKARLSSESYRDLRASKMRQKRAKTYRRLMALYTQTFNFRPPFQILGKSIDPHTAQQRP